MADVDEIMTTCGTNAEACRDICLKGCAAFRKFDKDGSGYLSQEEIADLLAAGKSGMTSEVS
jgi:Ca2+-binding EF-hand superfamily protein